MRCLDRCGHPVDTHDNATGFFRFLYDCAAGKPLLFALCRPGLSALAGRFLSTHISRRLITPFIRSNGIDMRDYPADNYRSFNEFFHRRIRDGARPLAPDPNALISPADGKLTVFPIDENACFEIKGIAYTIPMTGTIGVAIYRFLSNTPA